MSGWTTFTIELRESDEYFEENNGRHMGDDAQDNAHEWASERDRQIVTAIRHASAIHPDNDKARQYLYVNLGGQVPENDFELIQALQEQIGSRLVRIHANNTSGEGTAEYWVQQNDEWFKEDEYAEDEGEEGVHQGQKAAAVMYARHNVPALAKRIPYYKNTVRDEYGIKR